MEAPGLSEAAPDKAAKPKSVPAKIAEVQAARADYFTPATSSRATAGMTV
jgi:hypothetical protein